MIFVIVENQTVPKNIVIVTEEVKLVDQNVIVMTVTIVLDIQIWIKIQTLNQKRKLNLQSDLFIFFDLIKDEIINKKDYLGQKEETNENVRINI